MPLKRVLALGVSAIALSGFAQGAFAYPALPNLVNLNFQQYNGVAPKNSFQNVNPVGWTGGTGLISIDSTTAGAQATDPGGIETYGNPGGSYTGNYVEADGNPTFESGFNYTVTGLTKNQTYTLTFYQGASEQTGYGLINGNPIPTTNQWIVSLGTSGLTLNGVGSGPTDPTYGPTETYSNADATASIEASPLMTVPYQGTVGFNFVSMNLTADSTTDILSFLAWGDNGSTVNLPPIAFLAGVNSANGLGAPVPEPASLAILAVGLAGLGGVVRRRRKKVATAA